MHVLTAKDLPVVLKDVRHPKMEDYLLMYSSWWNALIEDPRLWMVPVDDHMVHRGDAVFEAFKAVDGKIYLLDAHINRMRDSAKAIGLDFEKRSNGLRELILKCATHTKEKNLLFRMYLSRGPGGFSPDPKESIGPQLYLIVQRLKNTKQETFDKGVKAAFATIPVKDPFFARIKSCNYLQNVLMKDEANKKGVEFCIGKNEDGDVLEGPTENLVLVTKDNELVFPKLETILRGTTMMRVFELVKNETSLVAKVQERPMTHADISHSKELLLMGTTLDVLSVVEFDGKPVGSGKPGPVSQKLLALVREDQKQPHWDTF